MWSIVFHTKLGMPQYQYGIKVLVLILVLVLSDIGIGINTSLWNVKYSERGWDKMYIWTHFHDQNDIILFRPIIKFVKVFALSECVWEQEEKEHERYFEAMMQ